MNPKQPFMLVDDNHDDLCLLKRLLTRAGVTNPFINFEDGDEAVRFLSAAIRTPASQSMPEAIFSDKQMPHRSGFELLNWVRQQPQLDGTPFVMFTNVAERGDATRALEMGAYGCFEKFPAQHVIEQIAADVRTGRRSRGG